MGGGYDMASGPLIEHLHTTADTLPDFLVFSRCVSVRRSGSSDDYRNQISIHLFT